MVQQREAVVVGGGVSGLTTAIRLAEAGFETTIVTAERAQQATSVVAAAVWFPEPAQPQLMAASFSVFESLLTTERAGVYEIDITEYTSQAPDPSPSWASVLRHFRTLASDEVPPSFAGGQLLGSIRMEPPLYLAYLERRFAELGGDIRLQHIDRLEAVAGPGRITVNCTGLGARELVGDSSMYPVRGQVVHVTNPGFDDGLLVETEGQPFTYILPRNEVVVLGGTRLVGEWSLEPDDVTTQRILDDARRLDPRLADADVVDVHVGLRPGRPRLRLERQDIDAGIVIHNYGHDGNGYGLSWGCAAEVVRLATS